MRGQSMIKRNNRGKILVIGFDAVIKHHCADEKIILRTDAVAVGRQRGAAAFVGDHGLPAVCPMPDQDMRAGFVPGMAFQHAMRMPHILLTHKGGIGMGVMRMADRSGLADRRRETEYRRH